MTLSPSDLHHLSSAEGWLDLGNWQQANEELENITPQFRVHPAVLAMRFRVYSEAKHWELALVVAETLVELLPEDPHAWIHRSFALHELKRMKEAQELLLPALEKFKREPLIAYNLACYACQLGNQDRAKELLALAYERGDPKEIKLMALNDPDLGPLWHSLK